MSDKPEKLKLDFLLNREERDVDHTRRSHGPKSSSSVSSATPAAEKLHQQSREARQRERDRRSLPSNPGSSTSHVPSASGHSPHTPPHISSQSDRMYHCDLCSKTFMERGTLSNFYSLLITQYSNFSHISLSFLFPICQEISTSIKAQSIERKKTNFVLSLGAARASVFVMV